MNANTPRLRLNPLASAIALAFTGASTLLLASHARAQDPRRRDHRHGLAHPARHELHDGCAGHRGHDRRSRDFKPGATVADQLDQLPQFFQTQSAQRGGGALFGGAGRSVIDLRAMGPQRTLVLLDGARSSPADRDGSVHIDNIPTRVALAGRGRDRRRFGRVRRRRARGRHELPA